MPVGGTAQIGPRNEERGASCAHWRLSAAPGARHEIRALLQQFRVGCCAGRRSRGGLLLLVVRDSHVYTGLALGAMDE